jgi:hypothetical protein
MQLYNGQRNEDGVLTKYEGWWDRDHRSSLGGGNTAVFKDGSIYHGGFKDDAFEGVGRYEWAAGHVYEGIWKEGVMEGTQGCVFTHANGKVLKGTFKRNLFLKESGKQAVFVNPLEDEARQAKHVKIFEEQVLSKKDKAAYEKRSRVYRATTE